MSRTQTSSALLSNLRAAAPASRLQVAYQYANWAEVDSISTVLDVILNAEPAVRAVGIVILRLMHERAVRQHDAELREALEAPHIAGALAFRLRDAHPETVNAASMTLQCIGTEIARDALANWRVETLGERRMGTGALSVSVIT